ncbi:MAG: ATP-binding cassette domain-containing protein [Chloracidobacterium sp.]|nr:ATP-binding cassette domain-containing protein [Chloracidobacterium sp.]MCC6824820.1 ATP-binding cassette domain-containing protein [Acidobacteriota bacterium]MCO5334048.1 ATP-binding cassette domain-containing protein [Pyrinomonadaceae bacterium]
MGFTVEELSKVTDGKWVLRDISFEVADGERIGILGGEGAGKTTLLRLIAGMDRSNGGKVEGLSPEDFIFPTPIRKTGIFGADKTSLSDCEARRQALDSALEADAPILLLDDLLAPADAFIQAFYAKKLRDSGKTIVMASSDFQRLAAVCDRIVIIDRSYLIQAGFTQQVYENPINVAAARLTGECNLIEARRLTSTNAELPEFQTIDGGHRLTARITAKGKLGAIHQSVSLAIRPEHVSISFEASFPEDNVIRGIVRDIRFHGPTTLVSLDCSGLELLARVFRVVGLNVGDECMIAMPPHRLNVLKS